MHDLRVPQITLLLALSVSAAVGAEEAIPLPPTAIYGMGRTDQPGNARDVYCWASTTRVATHEAAIDPELRKKLIADLDELVLLLEPLTKSEDPDASARARAEAEKSQKRMAELTDEKARRLIRTQLKRVFLYEFLLMNGSDVVSESPEQFGLSDDQRTALRKLAEQRSKTFKSLPQDNPAQSMTTLHEMRVAVLNALTESQRDMLSAYIDRTLDEAKRK